jgi:hypothetical protein
MRISVDDWHFREARAELVLLDVFLDNGQHGVLEINPMRNLAAVNGGVPEMIMFCELPGERITEEGAPARWIARPPSRECPWSNVQLPHALLEQIKQRLNVPATV